MLDILSSPLKSYLAQTLQYYLSKYLKDIHLEGFGFFGSDLVLNDLEIKRHVLQTALDIPSSFDFSRGFIRELRIHIPWTQILSQPIEIKLYTVELILTSKDEQPSTSSSRRRRRQSYGSECSSATLNTQTSKPPMDGNDQQSQIEPPKSTWLQSMLSKILANISIQVNNLVLKYEQEDIVLSVTLGLLDVYSANANQKWTRGFDEPKGDDKSISKRMDANDISIFLDRYTSDRLSVDVDSDIIHRQVIGYEVPVLRRTSFGVRVQYALEPTLFGVVPSTPKATYMPSRFTDPFSGHRLHDRPTFLLMDVYINELNLSLSDRQVQMLVHVTTTTPPPTPSSSPSKPPAKSSPLHRAHSTPLPPAPLSLDHHNLARPLVSEPTNISPPTTTTTSTTSSWSTWAMDMLVGAPPDDLEAELLQGIQATNIYQSNPTMPTTSTTPFPPSSLVSIEGDEYYTAISRDNQDDMSAALLPPSSQHLLTVRVSIQHISLTLRCHAHTTAAAADDGVDTAATIISTPDQAAFLFASPYPPDKHHEYAVEYVPVANMGLVQVASYSPLHTKTKVSKAADPVAVFTVTGTLIAWSTDQTHVKELEVDIENVVGVHHHHIMQPKPQQPPPLSIPLDAKHRSTLLPALTTEFIRMGTFHSSNQRSIAHANISQSLFAPDLQNQTTWNPQLERFRHLQWDPSTQVHCYQYARPPSPVSGDALTSPEDSTSNTFPMKCTCNVGTEHSMSSIQSFWADSLPTLCQAAAAAAASKLLSRHECTAAANSLTDEIALRLHSQYTVPSSHKTSTILLQDLVENTFENAINLTQGSSTARKSRTDTAGITSSLPQEDPSMAAMLFNMLVPALVVYSAQLVGHTCRSRATPSAIRIHMVEDISPPLMDPPMSKAVADVSVGVVEVIVTVPVLIAAVDFVQRIELSKASLSVDKVCCVDELHGDGHRLSKTAAAATMPEDPSEAWTHHKQQQQFFLHLSRVTLQCTVEDKTPLVQVALDSLWFESTLQSRRPPNSSTDIPTTSIPTCWKGLVSMDTLSGDVNDTTVVRVRQVDATWLWRWQPDDDKAETSPWSRCKCVFEVDASIHAVTGRWSHQVGVDVLTKVLPMVQTVGVLQCRLGLQQWSTDWLAAAKPTYDMFQIAVCGLSGHARIAEANPYHEDAAPTGIETTMDVTVMSATCHRAGRVFAHNMSGQAEQRLASPSPRNPWILVQGSAWVFPSTGTAGRTQQRLLRVFRHVLDMAGLGGHLISTQDIMGARGDDNEEEGHQVDWTGDVHVAGFEVDWRHIVAFLAVVPPSSQAMMTKLPTPPSPSRPSPVLPRPCHNDVAPATTSTTSRHTWRPSVQGWTCKLNVRCDGSTWKLTRYVSLTTPQVTLNTVNSSSSPSPRRNQAGVVVGSWSVAMAVSEWGVQCQDRRVLWSDGIAATLDLEHTKHPPVLCLHQGESSEFDSIDVDVAIALDTVACFMSPLDVVLLASTPVPLSSRARIDSSHPPTTSFVPASESVGSPSSSSTVAWCIKAGVQVQHVDVQLLCPSNRIHFMARNLSTALRTGNYPPLHPVAASHTTFVDSQLLLLDMSMLEDRTLSHTCWLLHAMPSSSLLGVLLCLEPRDIHSFAVAAGVTDIQAPEMIDTDPVLRWQYATHLARQCITAPATMPRPRRRATQPLLCTAHSFAMPSDDEGDSVFLALFVRNAYTGLESSSSPRAAATTLHVTGHMEAMDIVVTLPSVQSIVDVADAISRQCSFRSSPQTATTPSKYQGVPDITFQVETLRVFLPTHTMLCIDHIHVDSGLPPLSMEGLSSPPFTPWTQKRRRPTIAPQPTADLTPHKLHTRLTNVYVATVQCRPDDQGTGPFEVCMARVGRRQALRIASVTYLVHPIFVSVEVAASSPHVSLHVTKVVVDLPRYAQSMALAGLAGAYVAAVRQSSIVRRQNRTRGPRASQYQQIVRPEEEHEEAEDILDSLCLFGWRVAVDGLELHVGTPPDTCQGTLRSSIVHVRVGCMSAAHSATSRQGLVSVKNVVVGFQSGDANEALIFGPFADPSEWQVAVERYPDTVLAASWSFESTHGWLWTGLVELQGVQCHVSVPFLHAIRPFTVGTTPVPQTNSIQTSSAADGVREPMHTTVSVAGVRPIRQCKLKLLWAPSVVTMSSSHENDDKASIMVTCGPTFASLHVGYNPTQVEQLVTCQQPRSSLHQYMPLDVVETMGTIQGIRVAVLHTVRFPTTTKPFGSPTPSSSSWTVFEAQIQSPDPASVLLQDVQVRMSASVKQVVESTQALERRNSRRLYCGGYYMTDVQLETTPMDAAICFQTWMRLHALVSELVSSSLSDEMDETNPCTPYARPDPMHRLHLESLPTLDDFAELVHTSIDSSRVHPLPGELLVCRPTPSPPNQFDITTIMRLLNPQNQVSSVDDLFKHMNAPWTHDTMNAVDLHSNRLVGSLQWTYHLPRRVTRVVAMPLPLKSKQIVNTLEWPRLDLSDHVTRLCDVWCDLRWWSMADNAFVSVGTFYVPWEPQQHKASADDYDDEDGDGYPSSFASALLSWVEPSTPTDEDIALERCLQSTVTPREYIPHRVESAQRWQLLWRLPSSSPSTSSSAGVDLEQLSRTIGQSLMASLRISSVSGPQDWTGLSLSCVIPHVQMTLRRGQGELHDVARVKVADVVLHMQCASSSSSSSSFRGTGTVSGDLQNMVTLSSVPVLPPVQVAIGGSSSYRPAASPEDKRRHLLCPLGSTDRNLPQILFLTRLNVRASPVHLQLTPYAVKCLLEWPTLLGHTPKQDLTDMRIVLANGTGNVVYFRQLLTTEYRQVSAHTSVVYSWQSISAPLQLQFALSQPPHTWSTGCALNQPGVLYRECPRHGSFWVDIVADGIQTKVTLRGSIVLHNYTAQSLRCRWSVSSNSVANTIVNAAMPCTACSRNDVCSCTAVSIMAQSNAILSLGLELPSCVSSHEDESSGGGWSTPVNLEPSVERLESATTTSQSNSTATCISIHTLKSQWHAWVVVTRAVSPVLQRSDVHRVTPRYTWVQVNVWPILHVYNALSIPVLVDIIDKSPSIPVVSKVLDAASDWALNQYNPLHQHTVVVSTSPSPHSNDSCMQSTHTCTLVHFDMPRFVSDDKDMPMYPSEATQIDVPNLGFAAITRHSSGNPVRCIALYPRYRVQNHLPVPIVLRRHPTDDDDNADMQHIPRYAARDTGWLSFEVGVTPHDTLVWSATPVTWHAPDGPHTALAWTFATSCLDTFPQQQRFQVRATTTCHTNAAVHTQHIITIAPTTVLCNTSEWPLCVSPVSMTVDMDISAAGTIPRIALPPLATWWVWDLADEAKCTTLQGPASKHVSSKRRGSTSGLAWIRHRLGSFDSSSVPQLGPSCSVRLSVANAANEFGWSRPIPMHATATMPSRHRLILPHRQHRHLMATVHKTTKDGLTTCVSISHDPQPPVAFHNHVNHVFGVTTRSIPGGVVMVPAQGIVEYDWDIQQTQYGDDDKGEDEEVEGGGGEDHISTRRPPPPITTTPSVFDATGKDLPPSRLRFRLCLPADNNNETADAAVGWSNELWVVEGIQFAKWTDKAVAVVLLVTAYMRAGTWIVRLECVEGPYTNHTPRHSTLLLQCRDQPSRNRHRTDQLHRTRVDITVDEIALSLFDEQAVVQSMYQELFRLSAKQCHVTWASASDAVPEAAKLRHDLGYLDHLHSFSTSVVHLGSLELIHLFDDCNFPVILATCPPSSSSALRMLTDADLLAKHISPSSESLLLRVIVAHPHAHSRAVPYYHTINVAVAPVLIQMEDSLVAKVKLWVVPLQPPSSPTVPDTAAGGYDDGTPESWHQPVCPKVFIEHLSIQPIEMTITARSIYGLDRTPLTLSAVTLTNVFCDPDQLIKDIAANYVADALVHSPMVLMSLNVFGNPAGFVRDVSTGVQDLVRMPLLAVAEHGYTPYSMTRGIVRGTASFLTHASVAALTSVSGIAMAISNSMNHLALAHQPRSQIMPNTFASGLSGGLVSLGSAVVGGATGVVTTPLTLLRDNQARGQDTGLRGGLVGVTKGLVGIVAQPMSGVASLVSMTSQGLLVEMGFGPVQPIPLQVALTRNEALHVRWKILSEWNVAGDIQYAPALYWDDMNTVPEQPTKAVLLNPLELSWLLPRDPGRLGLCKVLLVVTPTHVFVVDEVEETIRRHIPLSHVTAMEQNVMEPTKFELGIGQPALKVQWYRFRLAAMDRRRLGRVVAALKKW